MTPSTSEVKAATVPVVLTSAIVRAFNCLPVITFVLISVSTLVFVTRITLALSATTVPFAPTPAAAAMLFTLLVVVSILPALSLIELFVVTSSAV